MMMRIYKSGMDVGGMRSPYEMRTELVHLVAG